VLDSRGYALIRQRLLGELGSCLDKLAVASEWGEACRLQGRIAGVRLALDGIPKILLEELKQQRR
jgi:hypothetical protein